MIEYKRTMKDKIWVYKNEVRRALVNWLLGKELYLKVIKTLNKSTVELVDMNRRLNYGVWQAEKKNEYFTQLNR